MSSTRKRGALSVLAITAADRPCHLRITQQHRRTPGVASNRSGDISGPLNTNGQGAPRQLRLALRNRAGTGRRGCRRSSPNVSLASRPSPRASAPGRSWTTTAATGTPRNLGRLDGFLTGPSSASAQSIAMGYVRDARGGPRPHQCRPRDVPAAPGLRRHRRHPPHLVDPVGPRDHGVQQRAQGQRDQDRADHLDPGIADLRTGRQGSRRQHDPAPLGRGGPGEGRRGRSRAR